MENNSNCNNPTRINIPGEDCFIPTTNPYATREGYFNPSNPNVNSQGYNPSNPNVVSGTHSMPVNGDNINKMHNVTIQQKNYRYLVEVGCHEFAIETYEKLLSLLGDYMKNPKETERAWFEGKLIK